MYDNILLPVDGSDADETALDHALAVAEGQGATLHALYVVDRRHYLAASEDVQEDVLTDLTTEGEHAVADAAEAAGTAGIEATTAVREGVPYREIVEYARETPLDLVVMGTHGRTGRDKLARLGSVTERVVENAPCPVLVVNVGERETVEQSTGPGGFAE
ncbi:MAG: universal stress protein [Halobacteriaceae archaeon]